MLEIWRDTRDFFKIQVSDHGNVRNPFTGKEVAQSENSGGEPKVNIVVNDIHYSRSVKELVAEAFVEKPSMMMMTERGSPIYTNLTVININGDKYDNRPENLAWRPRWFAWKYTRQFNVEPPPDYYVPVVNERTGEVFENTMEAGISEGLLWEHVINSAASGRKVFPTGSWFSFA